MEAFRDELFMRFVFWWLQSGKDGPGFPGLAYLEGNAVSEYRLSQSFDASKTGLRLVLFQVFFMNRIVKRPGQSLNQLRAEFDIRYGLPPDGLATELVEYINAIYKVDNFGTWAKMLGYEVS